MKAVKEFLRLSIVPVVLLMGILLTVVFTYFYTMTIRSKSGELMLSNWPEKFCKDFAENICFEENLPIVSTKGKLLLEEEELWIQILDAQGNEVTNYLKPSSVPTSYTPMEFLQLYQKGIEETSVFTGTVTNANETYTYLIGVPFSISKNVMYIDNARYQNGKILIVTVVILTAILVISLTILSYRTIRVSERRRLLDEKAKEEWLANITHDLKTPLAPIRGYAELLAEGEAPDEKAVHYGEIILKNVLHTQELVDDLKLTYQLQSNLFPIKRETENLVRFIKETIIDILNSPEYENRKISFTCEKEELFFTFDSKLLRRAMENIMINALKHNNQATAITVSVRSEKGIQVIVSDNGSGMTPQELEGLFQRYYRGTSTEVKAEGSGLGMAIAKQIVEAHGGEISAESTLGEGTEVKLHFKN